MTKWFDYSFYRFYDWYSKRDPHPMLYAVGLTSVYQIFLFFATYIALDLIYAFNFEHLKFVALIPAGALLVFNSIRYRDRVRVLRLKFHDEEKRLKRYKGILLITTLLLVLVIPILLGFLKHNLKII